MQNDDQPDRLDADMPHNRAPEAGIDELSDAAERLEESYWEDPRQGQHRQQRPVYSSGLLSGEDVGRVRSILERQLRQRPLATLLLAVGAGWLAGKLLR